MFIGFFTCNSDNDENLIELKPEQTLQCLSKHFWDLRKELGFFPDWNLFK